MLSAEEIFAEIRQVEDEITVVDRRRIELTRQLNALRTKAQFLREKYNLVKSKVASSVDYTSREYSWSKKVKDVLNNTFKLKDFRQTQLGAINACLSGKDVILLMPTGGGKSLCYQLPALVTNGITLVVSPLLSLIDDQIISLNKLGIDALTINSSNSKTVSKKIYDILTSGAIQGKIIYVTPEWMAKSKRFMTNLQKCYSRKALDRIAIDEVHCCSQWGHDFRPDYKFLGILKNIFPNIPILGLTATATDKIITDCQDMLNIQGCIVLRAPFNRPNLFYQVRLKPSNQEKCLDMLEDLLTRKYKNESGIIYTLTINESVELATELRKRGVSIACYHASMEPEMRYKIHTKWLLKQYQVVAATVAFGMGIDKPDVRFVIHHCLPKSMENFYQESGRAGRDNLKADCLLLYGLKDVFRVSSMVCTTQNGTANLYKMVEYSIEPNCCRRTIIAKHFDESFDPMTCEKMCDHCNIPQRPKEISLKKHCSDIFEIISFSAKSENRLTALKLLDAWFQSGGSKGVRPPNLKKPLITREMGERIIAYLLVKGYLKEDIHFTPYSTISYIIKGTKENILDDILMPVPGSTILDSSDFSSTASGSKNDHNSSARKKRKIDESGDNR